jgi:hypothetical protein
MPVPSSRPLTARSGGLSWQRLDTLVGCALGLHCPTCGPRFHRGQHDHLFGAYLVNLIADELLLGIGLLVAPIATWPNPPGNGIGHGGVALMMLAPLALYPFTEMLRRAFVVPSRALLPAEPTWHRERSLESRELPHR